jgi:chromosome condensin MukBEF ATPase and DNA-binding subunit MukB
MNILEHPIYREIYDLCQLIETLPASDLQTLIVGKTVALESPVRRILQEQHALKARLRQAEAAIAQAYSAIQLFVDWCKTPDMTITPEVIEAQHDALSGAKGNPLLQRLHCYEEVLKFALSCQYAGLSRADLAGILAKIQLEASDALAAKSP